MISGADSKLLDATKHIGEERSLPMMGTLAKPIMVSDMEAMLFRCMLRPGERSLVAEDLARAINEGELSVHFQPIVSLAKTPLTRSKAVEALVRWRHPERGLLLPAAFIGLADENNLMINLTDAVLLQVVEQIQVWKLAGIDMRVHVNLTCSVIDDPEFPERLFGLIRQFDLEPSQLVLEFSERGSLLDVLQRLDILTRLRLKGFGLALDDFGTGNSSLVHLHKLPFNILKIDQCFIIEMATSRKASLMVKSLIDLAHNLEMEVCAEGVSDRSALSALSEFGCDLAQGYFFSEAVPASAVAKNLRIWTISGNHG
jgi:EAL domain-containing protein (putative c-di-GMP-specific phosphodiesterase class I)